MSDCDVFSIKTTIHTPYALKSPQDTVIKSLLNGFVCNMSSVESFGNLVFTTAVLLAYRETGSIPRDMLSNRISSTPASAVSQLHLDPNPSQRPLPTRNR